MSERSSDGPIAPYTIVLDQTTTADLLVELGSPLRVCRKEDERLRIHDMILSPIDREDEEGLSKWVDGCLESG